MAKKIKEPLTVGQTYVWRVRGQDIGVYVCKEYKNVDVLGTGCEWVVAMDIEWESPDLDISPFYSRKTTDNKLRVMRKDILSQKVKKGHFVPV